MKLKDVIAKHSSLEPAPLGGGAKKVLSPQEREALRRDLQAIEKSTGRMVWIGVALLVLLVGAWIWLVLLSGANVERMEAASAAFGLSAAGCITALFRVWRERSSAALLLRLAIDLEGRALTAVIDVLAARARAGSLTPSLEEL